MYTLKSPQKIIRKHQPKYKLKEILQNYHPSQNINYVVSAKNNYLQFLIHRKDGSQNMNFNNSLKMLDDGKDKNNKKNLGLFAKIIKNMQIQKAIPAQNQKVYKQKQFPISYNYYFEQFRKKENKNEYSEQHSPSNNLINSDEELAVKKEDIVNKNGSSTKNRQNFKRNQNKELIDINFSFDQINQQLKQKRLVSQQNQDTIINKYLNNSNRSNQESFHQQQRIKEIFMIKSVQNLVQELCNKNLSELTNQIVPEQQKMILKEQAEEMVAQNMPPIPQQQFLEGTKPIQSQIYENKSKSILQEIKIQFDLDLNFI